MDSPVFQNWFPPNSTIGSLYLPEPPIFAENMSIAPFVLRRSAFSEILVLTGLSLLGIVVFSGLGLVLAAYVLDIDRNDLMNLTYLEGFGSQGRIAMLVLQGLTSLGSFVLFPWFLHFLRPDSPFQGKSGISPNATLFLLVFGLGILMMPVNSWLSVWNQAIQLPSFLDGFQSWAFAKEQEMEKLTLFLVDFSTPIEMVLGFLVVSVIAGFSEEYFFRRMLQPRVIGLFGNPHVGIWVTAFIFAAIHFQFYGLFPRMVLGALFGYYFWWTGNIGLSVFAHSLNNGITLVGITLYKANVSPINVEDPKQIPWFLGAAAAGITWSLASLVKEEADKIRLRTMEKSDFKQSRF